MGSEMCIRDRFLILSFFNAAALFLIAGAEFLAMILVIVYVGAVAVLFLFVVMMLDIDFTELREGVQRYKWTGLAVGGLLLVELLVVLSGWTFYPDAAKLRFAPIAAVLLIPAGVAENRTDIAAGANFQPPSTKISSANSTVTTASPTGR